MLTGGKFALSWIPNVEIVTLLLTVFACSYGVKTALPAATAFSLTEVLIYGFGFWNISYLVHWNALVIAVALVKKSGAESEYVYALAAALMSFLFGLSSAFVDVALSGGFSYFGARFSSYYIAGAVFYIIHIFSNYIIVLLLFKPFKKTAETLKLRYFEQL